MLLGTGGVKYSTARISAEVDKMDGPHFDVHGRPPQKLLTNTSLLAPRGGMGCRPWRARWVVSSCKGRRWGPPAAAKKG